MAEIERLDVDGADEATLAAIHELETDFWAAVVPEDPRPVAAFTVRRLRHRNPFREQPRWVARDGGAVVGWGELTLGRDRESNNHSAEAWVCVDPAHRRRGIGRALLEAAAADAGADGRRVLDTWALVDTPGAAFLDALGAERRIVERYSRVRVADLDRSMLDDWVRQVKERASDYSLLAIDGPVPEELIDDYTRLVHVMNDAPLEELDREDEVITPAMTRARNEEMQALGADRWCLVARHDGTGEWAGYTELHFNELTPWCADQGATGVFPAHRERGLGRWLKAANLLRLVEEKPDVRAVDTDNAGSNAPMLAINDAIGFAATAWFAGWQQDVEEAAVALGGR